MEEKPVKKFSECVDPLLSELLDQTFVVKAFKTSDAHSLGTRVTLDTDKGMYVTFSGVILDQLKMLLSKNDFPVEVTLRKEGQYYKFV